MWQRHFSVVILLMTLVPGNVSAQEGILTESGMVADEFTTSPTSPDHSGLLGKRYFQARYLQAHLNDETAALFDDSLQGFDTRLNFPIINPGKIGPFGLDLQMGYSYLTLGGSEYFPPPIDTTIRVRAQAESFQAAATLYSTTLDSLRPFTQLGLGHNITDASLSIGGAKFSETDSETEFLMVLGVEQDVTEWAALRLAFDLELQDRFSDTQFFAETILWPLNQIFLRGGLMTPLNGDSIGFIAGGGFVF